MKDLKGKIIEFWQDRKKRKGAIIAGIVAATVIASVTTITITGINGSTGDNQSNTVATNSTPTGAYNMLPNNTTSPDGQGNATAQQDSTKQQASKELASPGSMADVPGVGGNSIKADEAHNSEDYYNASSDNQANAPTSEPVSVECVVAIDCSSISGNGILSAAGKPWLEEYAANPSILPAVSMKVVDANGDGKVGVDEAIKQACNTYGIQYEFKGGSYLKGMNYLYEFDAGKNSGWMYSVNGINPNKGCNSYYLNGGEDILWYYVISY